MAGTGPRDELRYLGARAPLWRPLALLLAIQAAACAAGAALAYVVASPALAKDYYSAHRTVKETWELLLPALGVGAAAALVVGGVLGALVLVRHSRRMRSVVLDVDGVLRAAGEGRLPAPARGDRAGDVPAEAAAAALEPLRVHVVELRRLAKELQHPSLELTYRSAATADIPPRDLRPLAGALDRTTRDLTQALDWFKD